jgi:rRNA biogenesis protein RRP5
MLGVVSDVHDFSIDISLPDLNHAVLRLTSISKTLEGVIADILANEDDDGAPSAPADESDDSDSGDAVQAPAKHSTPLSRVAKLQATARSCFRPGMFIPCVQLPAKPAETGTPAKRKGPREVSTSPALINAGLDISMISPNTLLFGCIKSVEDRGFLVDLGSSSFHGFLPLKHAQASDACSFPASLEPGFPLVCTALKVDTGKGVVTLSLDITASLSVAVQDKQPQTIYTVLPGMICHASVNSVARDGLFLRAWDDMVATCSRFHVDPASFIDQPTAVSKFPKGKRLLVRLLFVEREQRRLGMSLLPALANPTPDLSLALVRRISSHQHPAC